MSRTACAESSRSNPTPTSGPTPPRSPTAASRSTARTPGLIALQAVADSSTRDPGWIYTSEADEVFYYYLAISQSEDEVRALFAEPDESFFAGLKVDRDDLLVLPLAPARAWFAERAERYPSRPVAFEGYSAWYRLVPRAEIQNALSGVTDRGPIFGGLGR